MDTMKRMYEAELANLTSCHQEEMETLEGNLTKEIRRLKESQDNYSISEELYNKAREEAISHVVEGIVAFISNEDRGESVSSLPMEFATLESIFAKKYKKLMNEQLTKHMEEIEALKAEFNQKLADFSKKMPAQEEKETFQPSTGSEELDKVIRERDCLKNINETLRSAVQQLTSYLSSCEDELNRTVIEELLRTPRKRGLPPSPKRVHFAPDISSVVDSFNIDSSAEISGLSSNIRSELESCLKKLKREAAAILGLTASQARSPENSTSNYLHRRATDLLNEKEGPEPSELISIIQEITYEGDSIIDTLRQEKEDLAEQVKAADSQLKSTRQFLDDQAAERENERDEYSREVRDLRTRIRDSRQSDNHLQEWSEVSNVSITPTSLHKHQIEDLELQLNAMNNDLKESEDHKKDLENELRSTLEKVWVLTDIISKLEGDIVTKSEREEWLEKRLDELEVELEQQSAAQQAMQDQMEAMKSEEHKEENYVQQMMALHEEIKRQYSSSSVRLMKTQLKEIENGVDQRIKELEALNLNGSTTSLSSPSEEISIREHLEALRSETPDCPSPVALPMDLVNKLQDKIIKQFRTEDIIIKKCKDQEMHMKKLSIILNEVQAERDVLVSKLEQSKGQLVEAGGKIDDLRQKAQTLQKTATKDLLRKVSRLEEEIVDLQRQLETARSELEERNDELRRAKTLIIDQNKKLANQAPPDLVDSLRLELANALAEKNKLQEIFENINQNEMESSQLAPLYDDLLEDKNQDILQLQRTVSFLQSQLDKSMAQQADSTHHDPLGKKDMSLSATVEISPIRMTDVIRDAPSMIEQPLQLAFDTTQTKGNVSNPVMSHSMRTVTLEDIEEEEDHDGELVSDTSEEEIEEYRLNNGENSVMLIVNQLKSAKAEAETRAAETAERLEALLQELALTRAEVSGLRSSKDEADRLRTAVAAKDEQIQRTTNDIEKLQETLSRLQEKVKQASVIASKDTDLKSEISALKEKCALMEEQVAQFGLLKEELLSLGVDSEFEESGDVEMLHDIVAKAKDKLDELSLKQQLVNNLTIEVAELKDSNSLLTKEVKKLQSLPTNQERIRELEEQVKSLSSEQLKLDSLEKEISQLKRDKSELADELKRLEMSRNLLNQEYDQLKLENLKKLEEITSLKSKIGFDSVDSASQTHSPDPKPCTSSRVPGLEALTSEIEKQLDLSAQLDHSLLSTISETPKKHVPPFTSLSSGAAGDSVPLRHRLESESDKWKIVDQKQSQLATQVDNLTRLVASQDQRITHLAVQLDEKKNQCLVLELDLLRERSELKQLQCILESERHKAKTIQKEDTSLIETLRLRLEACMRTEGQLKAMLLEEKDKCETLQACLNSARALEKYVSKSTLTSPNHNTNNEMLLRIEVERLKQHITDLEGVIARERQTQSKMKDKLRSLESAFSSLEKQCDAVKRELVDEVRARESAEERARIAERFATGRSDPFEHDIRLSTLAQEIHQWKEECLELREHLQLQRETQDRWAANVQTPLMRQLSEVNRSLEKLVGEKIGLQTHVKDLEKERSTLLRRVRQLEEICSSRNRQGLASLSSECCSLSSLSEKFEEVMDSYLKLGTFRKSLIWQKKYLLVTLAGYQRSHEENLGRFNIPVSPDLTRKRTFRSVALTVCAAFRFSNIHRRRSARRKMVTLQVLKEKAVPKTNKNPPGGSALTTTQVQRDQSLPPSWLEMAMDMPEELLEPSRLRHYVVMFDDLQKRLGRILQES